MFLIAGTWLLAEDLREAMGDDLGFVAAADRRVRRERGDRRHRAAVRHHRDRARTRTPRPRTSTSSPAPTRWSQIGDSGNLPVYGYALAAGAGAAQADVLDAWAAANDQGAIVPYLDYATPDFYDLLTAADPGPAGRATRDPDAFLDALEKEYTSFTGSGG